LTPSGEQEPLASTYGRLVDSIDVRYEADPKLRYVVDPPLL